MYHGVSIYLPNTQLNQEKPNIKVGSVDRFDKAGKSVAAPGVNDYMVVYSF